MKKIINILPFLFLYSVVVSGQNMDSIHTSLPREIKNLHILKVNLFSPIEANPVAEISWEIQNLIKSKAHQITFGYINGGGSSFLNQLESFFTSNSDYINRKNVTGGRLKYEYRLLTPGKSFYATPEIGYKYLRSDVDHEKMVENSSTFYYQSISYAENKHVVLMHIKLGWQKAEKAVLWNAPLFFDAYIGAGFRVVGETVSHLSSNLPLTNNIPQEFAYLEEQNQGIRILPSISLGFKMGVGLSKIK